MNSGEAFRGLIACSPGSAEARSSLALNYYCRNKLDSAKATWREAVKQDRDLAPALLGLALCAKAEGDTPTLDRLLERASAIDARVTDLAHLRYDEMWPVEAADAAAHLKRP